ncbi:MAG: TonB-dependent receptor [Oceanobacter sp.]
MKTNTLRQALLLAAGVAVTANGWAHGDDHGLVEEILVTGGVENIRTLGGSAQMLGKYELEQLDSTDLNQIIGQLPGVYLRQEDGFGLRPNIGLRGATSERSQKVTLMEDGVLIAPAPYTAPAAYYLPNINRMSAVEVVKGPSAVRHGPHTVGGAINFATRPVSWEPETLADISLGSWDYRKYRLLHEGHTESVGYWIDALHYSSTGFKDLDGGGDTGFVRNDLNAKVQWRLEGEYDQLLTLKLGFADEDSDETYLGLMQEDFSDDPYRRYAASQNDQFESEHRQIHLEHSIELSDETSLNTKLYWNEFDRAWNKFDGFQAGLSASDVLANPERFSREYGILTGQRDSVTGEARDTLDLTNNDRQYGSYGIQTAYSGWLQVGEVEHQWLVGLRYHHDWVERNHREAGYLMQNGKLVNDGIAYGSKAINEASTDAVAVFVEDAMQWQDWTVTVGARYESIEGEFKNLKDGGESSSKSQSILIPGMGVYWQMTDEIGLLAGVNKGFSPAAPSAGSDVDPEESLNVEYGVRYQDEILYADAIGFYSDYDNLLGRCRVSDPGCTAGEEFNGGSVKVAGLEVSGNLEMDITSAITLPVNLSYTYTESAFQGDFNSSFSQWGNVQKGYELPYLPKHIAYISAGLKSWEWDAQLAANYQSAMRDVAGSGSVESGVHTDAYTTLDASAGWEVDDALRLQLNVDNLTDRKAVVSRRPFGARPNKPRTVRLRAVYRF